MEATVMVPTWFTISWFVLLCMMGIETMLLILMSIWTPAKVFLKAKIKKSPIIFILGRDRSGAFRIGKPFGAVAAVKGVGPFILTENSGIMEKSSSVPLFLAFGEYAKTLSIWWVALLEYFREKGMNMTRWSDYDVLIKAAAGKAPEKDKDIKNLQKFLKKEHNKDFSIDEIVEGLKGLEVELRPYRTIKLHNLVNMFPNTLDPHLVEARTEWKVIEQKKKSAGMDKQTVFLFVMLLLGVVLAAVIAFKFLKTGDATCSCQFPGGVWDTGKMVAQNLTG